MTTLDIAIVIGYLCICIFSGFYRFKKIESIREYSIGDRNASTIVLVATVIATAMGSGSCIGAISKIHKEGLLYAIPLFFTFIYWLIMGKIFSADLSAFRKFITLSEVMTFLYGNIAGWICSLVIIINCIGLISLQITAIGYVIDYYFQLGYNTGAAIGMLVIVTYCVYGGFRAVAFSDLFQSALFFIVLPITCGLMLRDVLEHKNFIDLFRGYDYVYSSKQNILFFISTFFYLIFPGISAPYFQRVLAAKNRAQISKLFLFVAGLTFIYCIVIILMGLALKLSNRLVISEQGLYFIISSYLPYGLIGFFLSAVLAITMSTADSWLHISSSVIAHDVIKKLLPSISKNYELHIARVSVVLTAVIALSFSLYNKTLLEKLWLTRNFWHPIVLIPLIAGIVGVRTHKNCFIYSLCSGIVFTIIGRMLSSEFGVVSLMMGTLASALFFFGSHYFLYANHKKVEQKEVRLLQNKISKFLDKVRSFFYKIYPIEMLEYFYFFICFFIITNIPFFVFLSFTGDYIGDINIYCRVIGSIMAMLLFFYGGIVKKSLLKKLYLLTLIFCLLLSSSLSMYLYKYDNILIINFMLSCVLFYFLTNFASVIIWGGATIASCYFIYRAISLVLTMEAKTNAPNSLSFYSSAVLFIAIIMFLFERERKKNQEIKLANAIASITAHDLRNPLALLQNYMYALKLSNVKANEKKNILNNMQNALDASSEVVKTFLANSSQADKIKLETYNIEDVLKSVIAMPFFDEVRTKIFNVIIRESFLVKIDFFLLKYVIINLLKNSIEALKNSHKKSIHIIIENLGNKGVLRIKDTGCGIEENDIDMIFDPFFSRKKDGSGIGLSFCKNALKKMNAEIECVSEYGKYTEFLIIFEVENAK